MLGEVRFSSSIPSAYESKVITVHLYCLIILWLTLILYTIYKQQSVYYHYFSALSSDNHNMSAMCSILSGNRNKVTSVHLYCLILSKLALVLFTIYKQHSVLLLYEVLSPGAKYLDST